MEVLSLNKICHKMGTEDVNADYYVKGSQERATESALTIRKLEKVRTRSSLVPKILETEFAFESCSAEN